ncbi:MAG: peptidase M28 family protein, partial [Calditrichaeota bacterium]|nr:peptidase M28 family protein [Calditrichota bacterium]
MRRAVVLLVLLVTHGVIGQVGAGFSGEVNARHVEVAQEIVRRALSDTVGYHLLRQLAAIGPRLVGSPASMQAIRWAERTMQQLGLEEVRLQEVTVPHWERGEKEVAEVVFPKALKGKRLGVAALGGSVATPRSGIRAQVIEVQGLEEV